MHKVALDFAVMFESDGTSPEFALNLDGGELLSVRAPGGGFVMVSTAALSTVTDVTSVSVDWDAGSIAASVDAGVVKVTFETIPPKGERHTIHGTLLF